MWGLTSVSLIRDPSDARLVSQFSKLRRSLVFGVGPITPATYVSFVQTLACVTHTRFEHLHNVEEARKSFTPGLPGLILYPGTSLTPRSYRRRFDNVYTRGIFEKIWKGFVRKRMRKNQRSHNYGRLVKTKFSIKRAQKYGSFFVSLTSKTILYAGITAIF